MRNFLKLLIVLVMITIPNVELISQPNTPVPCPPACFEKNPPTWCDCDTNPVPLDDYLPILMLGGMIIGTAAIYMGRKELINKTK